MKLAARKHDTRVGHSILARVCSGATATPSELGALKSIEQKLMWLASYTVHNANTLREKKDSLKVCCIALHHWLSSS